MKRILVRALEIALVPTIALGLALAIAPAHAALMVRIWLLVVLGEALLATAGAIRASCPDGPSPFAAALSQDDTPRLELPELARLEREVAMATGSAFDLHFRLRPTVRALAAGLLRSRRGVDLDGSPEHARALLGDETWQLVRDDRPAPRDRRGPGIDLARLERVVASLERL